MVGKLALWAVLAALPLLTSPAVAAPPADGDPCAVTQAAAPSARLPTRIQIEHDSAIYIVKHVQRACRLIDDLVRDKAVLSDPRMAIALRAVGENLRQRVLTPVYREHPDLLGRDLTSAQTDEDRRLKALSDALSNPDDSEPHLAPKPRMGPATALYLRWALADAQASLSKASKPQSCSGASAETCVKAIIDVIAEIGFADTPIYSSYPGLWRIVIKQAAALAASSRTAASDAVFRKSAPAPGSVKLTPAALASIRDFLAGARRDNGDNCEVADVFWSRETRWKGPEDSEWKTSGPGLSIGADRCDRFPPDVIQIIDGIRFVFAAKEAGRFTGKVIDRENGRFVLKEP